MNLFVARILSLILNPLVVIVLVPFFLIYKTTDDLLAAFNWTMYTVVFLLGIALFILHMVRTGKFTDIDVSKREQRPILFLVSMLVAIIYLIGLFIFDAPSILYVLTFTIIIGILLASIINNFIKASMHTGTIASLIVGLALVYGGYYYLFLLVIPVVAYIRVRAKRHTVPETIAGAIFGSALSIFMYYMVTSFLG